MTSTSIPQHSVLATLPFGLWSGSIVFDLLSLSSSSPSFGNIFVQASFYCILLGVIAAISVGNASFDVFGRLVRLAKRMKSFRRSEIEKTNLILKGALLSGYILQLYLRDSLLQKTQIPISTLLLNFVQLLVLWVGLKTNFKTLYSFAHLRKIPEVAKEEAEIKKAA